MRIERISENQFLIYLTYEDLVERGFTKEDIIQNTKKLEPLFKDMMYEASYELGFELEGKLQIHVHIMKAQGMHIIVTQHEDDFEDEEFVELQVTLDESHEIIFAFENFEHMIQVSFYLKANEIHGGSVYIFEDNYYLTFSEQEIAHCDQENIIAILSEFAKPSIVTSVRLEEYGKPIFTENAVQKIVHHFSS